MNNDNNIYNKLIELSKIFKKGFTVEIKNHNIFQYINIYKPFIVSYKTIISIDLNKDNINTVKFNHVHNKLKNCVIGGYYDKSNNIYLIEICKTFDFLTDALKYAYKNKQKSIYDIKKQKEVKVKDYINKKYIDIRMW